MKRVLVTGAAGFIGSFVARRLLDEGRLVVGMDNLSAYYDVGLKRDRLEQLEGIDGFRFVRCDLGRRPGLREGLRREPDRRCHPPGRPAWSSLFPRESSSVRGQ